ncbi:hypothetical protein RB195_009253 [Necator americanus]|uniref:Uncharacterized protein n=1 Tax=Necator americanus TaxID=51031 RepID=A0ABR1CSJ4_NECAM
MAGRLLIEYVSQQQDPTFLVVIEHGSRNSHFQRNYYTSSAEFLKASLSRCALLGHKMENKNDYPEVQKNQEGKMFRTKKKLFRT